MSTKRKQVAKPQWRVVFVQGARWFDAAQLRALAEAVDWRLAEHLGRKSASGTWWTTKPKSKAEAARRRKVEAEHKTSSQQWDAKDEAALRAEATTLRYAACRLEQDNGLTGTLEVAVEEILQARGLGIGYELTKPKGARP